MSSKRINKFTLAIIAGIAIGTCSSAEAKVGRGVYGSFYLGPSFVNSSNIETTNVIVFEDVGYKTGLSLGGKIGYWHNAFFGGALDIFSYGAAAQDQTVTLSRQGRTVGTASFSESNVKYGSTAIAFNFLRSAIAYQDDSKHGACEGECHLFKVHRAKRNIHAITGILQCFILPEAYFYF